MRRTTVVVALVAALVVAPSPAVSDPGPGGPSPQGAKRLVRAWTGLPAKGLIGSSPTYAKGSVYYTEDAFPVSDPRSGKRLSRRDAVTGRPLPFAAPALPTQFLTDPATDGRRIFTISADENAGPVSRVRAFTLDGRTLWVRRVPGEKVLAKTVVAGPLVIAAGEFDCDREPEAGCERTTVSAWWAATGKPAWQRTVTGGAPDVVSAAGRMSSRALKSAAGWQVTVSSATTPGKADVVALDAFTGRQLWTRTRLAGGSLAADAGSVYLAAGDLCALRAVDGRRRWCVKDRRYHDVTVAGDALYTVSDDPLADRDQRIIAFTSGGRARWSVPASPTGPLTVAGGVVYFQHYPADGPVLPHPVDRPTQLVALRGDSGARLTELPISDGYSSGAVAVGGGRVFTSAYLTAVVGYAPA